MWRLKTIRPFDIDINNKTISDNDINTNTERETDMSIAEQFITDDILAAYRIHTSDSRMEIERIKRDFDELMEKRNELYNSKDKDS